jgi:hypothetical protein
MTIQLCGTCLWIWQPGVRCVLLLAASPGVQGGRLWQENAFSEVDGHERVAFVAAIARQLCACVCV